MADDVSHNVVLRVALLATTLALRPSPTSGSTTIIYKMKKGREYACRVRLPRVNGKPPRVVIDADIPGREFGGRLCLT